MEEKTLSKIQQLQVEYGLRPADLPADEMLSDEERKRLAVAFAAGLAALVEDPPDDSGAVQPA